jgi:hypothetical protein
VELVRALADGPVSDLPAAVALLDRVDPSRLEPSDRVALVRAIDRCEAALSGLKVRAIAAVADAYEEPDDTAALVEDAVLGRLPRQTVAETRRAVADAVVRLDPAAAAERARAAKADRRIDRVPDRDGRTGWFVPMSVAEEGDAWGHCTRLAKQVRAARRAAGLDCEPLDALRVDAALDLLLGRDPLREATAADAESSCTSSTSSMSSTSSRSSSAVPEPALARCSCGGKQVAAVVLDAGTLLGLVDNPGRVPGYGLVPADLARAMAADRDLVRWLVDPGTGELIDVGAETYRPSARMRRFILARDQRCSFPGCGRRAEQCDLDHLHAFSYLTRGGKTVRVNLGPLCRQQHNAKTHGGWTLSYDPTTRSRECTSPLGATYLTTATPVLT